MNTKYLIIVVILSGFGLLVFAGFTGMVSIQAFGSCGENPDWPSAPCHDAGESIKQMQKEWGPYYKYKGMHWMEQKWYEMNIAIQNNALLDWINLTEDTQANRNVHKYYYLKGQVPDLKGQFLPVCNIYEDTSRYHEILKNDVVLQEFLSRYPDTISSHSEVPGISRPKSTIFYQYDAADYSVSLHIRVYQGSDTKLCLEPFSYTINYHDNSTDSQITNYYDDTAELLQFLDSIPSDYVQSHYFLNPEFETYAMTLNDDLKFLIPYNVSDARVEQITMDCNSSLLVLYLGDVGENGKIILNIPRALVDHRVGNEDGSFRIMLDGIRLEYAWHTYSDTSSRTVHMNLEPGSKTLEIYGNYSGLRQANEPVSCIKGDPNYHRSASPLKQFDLGIHYHEIQCDESLTLVAKHDGSPACVKSESIPKLIERKWASENQRLPPLIDFDNPERISREVSYLGLMMLLPHIEPDESVAVSLEGRTNLVLQMVDHYGITPLSSKSSPDESYSSIFGKIIRSDLQRFFEDEPMNLFAKHGILFTSVGRYSDESGTHGPFNQFQEDKIIGKILEHYENKRKNMEEIQWSDFVEWPTGIIKEEFVQELEMEEREHLCKTYSGTWDQDFAACFDFSDEFNCLDLGGFYEDRGYTSGKSDYSKISDSYVCMFEK